MTKVYLVTMHECDANGWVKENGKTIVDCLFTNLSKAKAYVKYMNTGRTPKYWWAWRTMEISQMDMRKEPF